MKKLFLVAVVLGVVVGLVSIAGYFAYSRAGSTPIVTTKDGMQAQVQSCSKGYDNYFHIVVLVKASPNDVKLHLIDAGARDWNGIGWSGTVILMRDGKEWGSMHFQNREGYWTATAPFSIPLIADPNYNCQLNVWTLVVNPDR